MDLTMENTVEYTEYMLREYYRLNAEPMLSVLDSDVMWIGPGNIFVFGAAAVRDLFKDGFIMPPVEIEDAEFYPLTAGKDARMVAGRFMAHSAPTADKVIAACQRVTMHYKQVGRQTRLTHLHVSNEWNELVGNEIFPLQVSIQTYRYVQKLVAESVSTRRDRKIEFRTDAAVQYIDPDLVVYAEAVGANTVVHLVDKNVTIKRILGDVAPLFPETFYRPHRSFLINCAMVASIERYAITLMTGMIIPIPEKRYTQVRNELTVLMEKM